MSNTRTASNHTKPSDPKPKSHEPTSKTTKTTLIKASDKKTESPKKSIPKASNHTKVLPNKTSESPTTLRELFIHQLQDLRFAEQEMIDLLPSVKAAASNQELSEAIENHQQESKQQLALLVEILKSENANSSKECFAIEGLAKEVQEAIDCDSPFAVKDAGIIAALQRVEHYEIAGYGTVLEFCKMLKESDYQDKIEEILNQEKKSDKTLSKIATGAWLSNGINKEAVNLGS